MSLTPTIDAWETDRGRAVAARRHLDRLAGRLQLRALLALRHRRHAALLPRQRPGDAGSRYRFAPRRNKTGRVWHCVRPAGRPARRHALRLPRRRPARSRRRPPLRSAEDPARPVRAGGALSARLRPRRRAPARADRRARARSACCRSRGPHFDWGDEPRPRHTHDLVVYELHVKGFTARANSGVSPAQRGTFAGLVEKIPYLLELGVTAVELMPVHQFDPQEGNYWGYMTLNFFAPHHALRRAATRSTSSARWCRRSTPPGIEVWLDVVYNHTSEGDADRPDLQLPRRRQRAATTCSRPDRRALRQRHRHRQHAALRRAGRAHADRRTACALDATTLRVDGFRFDLASILARRADGTLDLDDPPIITEISALAAAGRRPRRRRGVGHQQLPARPQLPRLHLAAMERQVPRRRARVRARRSGQGRRR